MIIDSEPRYNKELDCIEFFGINERRRSITGEVLGRLYRVDRHYVLQYIEYYYSPLPTEKPIAVYNTTNKKKAIKFSVRDLEKRVN